MCVCVEGIYLTRKGKKETLGNQLAPSATIQLESILL